MIAIDTNVLVYASDSAEPVKQQQAMDLLVGLKQAREPVVLPWQVAVEYLACLRRSEQTGRVSRNTTLQLLRDLEETFPFVFPTPGVLHKSLDLSARFSLSHWDSLLVASCIEAGVTTLYSEDLDAGMTYETVTVRNPFAA